MTSITVKALDDLGGLDKAGERRASRGQREP